MKEFTPILKILQAVITDDELNNILNTLGYQDKGRILTVGVFFRYLLLSAILKSDGYRELHTQGVQYGLPKVDYSTLSKKAKEIPFEIFLYICNHILAKSNRTTRRKMDPVISRMVAAIDSTCITAHKNKLPWAPYLKESSGIKYHVKFAVDSKLPIQVIPSVIHTGDAEKLPEFRDNNNILVCDRGYRNIAKLSELDFKGQEFVVRLKDNITMLNQIPIDIQHEEGYTDVLCTLGKDRALKKEYRCHQFRVIKFVGNGGKTVMLCTNIIDLSAEVIAEIYRKRWSIECFFRTLKQNFSIKKVFGTTMNAVYSQGLIAFIAYVLTYCSYTKLKFRGKFNDTFHNFLRCLRSNSLRLHWKVFCNSLLP